MTFCEKLTTRERRGGRLPSDWKVALPTEAQWEYACRAGTESAFSFGTTANRLGDYAWFSDNADDVGEKYAHLVGLKRANSWNLHDLHGNVWEWCRDVYIEKLPGGRDPLVSSGGSSRIRRGGSWSNSSWNCRSADRSRCVQSRRVSHLGFRVAVTATQ